MAAEGSVEDGGKTSAPGSNLRIVFAAIWLLLQAGLVLTANRRIDGAFGFRMFSESSVMTLSLWREVNGTRVHADEGVWTARGADGVARRMTWYDRVPLPYWVFDREMQASYGAATQLGRLQAALDDVATHTPNDAETRRFVLEVSVRKNGHETSIHELVSAERLGAR